MRVHELRTILEHLPDDLPVMVRAGRGLVYVDQALRSTAARLGSGRWAGPGPAALILEGRVNWQEPEPPFRLRGRFRRADELLARLGDEPIGEKP